MKPDQSLLQACRRGDARAWQQIVDRYERLVYSIPLNFGLRHADADDVAQTTFTALLKSLDAIEDEERLGAWLATVARRQTWRLVERQRRESPDDHAHLDRITTDDDARTKVERLEWLHQGLSLVDDRCRELLTSLYFDDSEPAYAVVAARFGIPIGSIGPTRARCLQKLRTHLETLQVQ
jgi:RNA polymerase sigma factor (sigma-70 family)